MFFFVAFFLLCVVFSSVNCTEGSIRLVVGDSYDYYLDRVMGEDVEYIDDRLSQGRVEMCVNGDYGTICADGGQWSFNESAVVCRELGFTAAGKLMDLIKRNCTCWFGLTFLNVRVHSFNACNYVHKKEINHICSQCIVGTVNDKLTCLRCYSSGKWFLLHPHSSYSAGESGVQWNRGDFETVQPHSQQGWRVHP